MDAKAARNLVTDLLNLSDDVEEDSQEVVPLYVRLQLLQKGKKSRKSAPKSLVKSNRLVRAIVKTLGIDVLGIWNFLILLAGCLTVYNLYYGYMVNPNHLQKESASKCIYDMPQAVQEIGRAQEKCDLCSKLESIPIEYNITQSQFIQKYAYNNIPVLIKNGIQNWTASQHFGLEFFKKTYRSKKDGFKHQHQNGQFFTYRNSFENLREALTMSKHRQKSPWYFGWSNNHAEVAKELRKHYQRPYFLPDSESSDIDWIFMGTSGPAAFLHLDSVNRPSWQAQIQGHKQWTMVPSVECMSVCRSFNVTVSPGDIIIVDTNRWFHSTYVHPGNISITIGSEYD